MGLTWSGSALRSPTMHVGAGGCAAISWLMASTRASVLARFFLLVELPDHP